MFKQKGLIVVVGVLLAVALLGACVTPTPMPPGWEPRPGLLDEIMGVRSPAAELAPVLEGTRWQLFAYVDPAGQLLLTLPGSEVTAQFADGQISGSAGCNNYFGTYVVVDHALTIEVGGTTMMACPESLMTQEQAYLSALDAAAGYRTEDGQMLILDDQDLPLLAFHPLVSAPLAGTTWLLSHYNNGYGGFTTTLQGSEVTAVFDGEGNLSGSAGCNNYFAPYQVTGDQITIGLAGATQMFCAEPEGLMEQEGAYLNALTMATNYAIEGNQLLLTAADGARIAAYVALEAAALPDEMSVALANLSYQSQWTGSGSAPLVDGAYSEPAAPDSASQVTVQLTESMAVGELDGQTAAAVVLATSTGGSGVFIDLAIVLENEGGELVNVATAPLGDRVRVNDVAIDGNQITVDMIAQGPNDPMCCPSQQVVQVYELRDGELLLVDGEGTGEGSAGGDTVATPEEAAPAGEPAVDIVGVVWLWEGFSDPVQGTIEVPDPANYRLQLSPGGTVRVLADCNRGGGVYAIEGSSIQIEIQTITRAACAPDSLSEAFIRYLNGARIYFTQDGNLFLDLFADSGTMRFAPEQ